MHLSSQANLHAKLVPAHYNANFLKGLYRNHIAVTIEAMGALRTQEKVWECASNQKESVCALVSKVGGSLKYYGCHQSLEPTNSQPLHSSVTCLALSHMSSA